MQKQVLLDKLSEFLMVEQGGLQLYRVASGRARQADLKQRYQEFEQQTAHHREVLTRLIQQVGGDPNYVSPAARVAQVKATKLMDSALIASDALAEALEASDLENVLLAETKDHTDWELLKHFGQQADDPRVKQAVQEAVREVEQQEDEHVQWARETLRQMGLRRLQQGPAPSSERWQRVISGPEPPVGTINPSPETADLLPAAKTPMWQDSSVARAMRSG